MTPQTRDTALRACRAALDTILQDIHLDSGWYARDDWRGQIHRKSAAVHIIELRRAIRELKPAPWPAWMAEPSRALEAMTADPR